MLDRSGANPGDTKHCLRLTNLTKKHNHHAFMQTIFIAVYIYNVYIKRNANRKEQKITPLLI